MSKRKSLSDRINTPIRGAITAFTTQNIEVTEDNLDKNKELNNTNTLTEKETKNDIESDSLSVKYNNTNKDTESITESNTKNDTINNTNKKTEFNTSYNTNYNTKDETNNNINNNTKYKTDNDTESVTKNETNKVNDASKIITSTKSIKVGNTVFKSTYYNEDDIKRAAYHLRQDTIDKVEKCSKLSGLKKAEFVDLVLNNILTDILNKIEK